MPLDDRISVVIPCRDEAASIAPLLDETFHTLDARLAEVIVVDDGSCDATPALLASLATAEPGLRVLSHRAPAGQSSAVRTGVRAARGRWVGTLDADGQNPPDQLLVLLAALARRPEGRIGLVQGERHARSDGPGKRWASRLANAVRTRALGDAVRDSACGLKLFRRSAFLELPWFEHIHRFLPAMMLREGWDVLAVPVEHRPRLAGASHYSNLQRGMVGLVDLAGAAWLQRRRSGVVPPGTTLREAAAAGRLDIAATGALA